MTTNLYRSGNSWIFDNKTTPTGTIKIDISNAPVVSFYYVSNGANVFDRAFNVSEILDANDTPYADFNTFISAVSDFFVKAPGGGGSTIELSTSFTETVAGKAADATVIKTLNDGKYPKLQNGNGNFSYAIIDIINNLVAIGFSLSGANLSYANLSNANLYGADLSNANLFYANLSNADLFYANLSNANLYGADLSNANLYGANLYGAYLESANLSNANLSNADLFYANLYGADLTNADLSGVLGLDSDINIALSSINKDTVAGSTWTLTWTDRNIYECNPETGLFTQQ